MRTKLSSGEVEIRVQERRVVSATAFHKGERIAGAQATCAPQDEFDLKEGEAIAVSRLAAELEKSQVAELQFAQAKISEALRQYGAIRANITLPEPKAAQQIVVEIMGKLDKRRNVPDNSYCPEGSKQCAARDPQGFICCAEKGHYGDHKAYIGRTHVASQWP